MNSQENSTGLAGGASGASKVLFGANIGNLNSYELWGLMDALCTIRQVVGGLAEQARFSADGDYNGAGSILDVLVDVTNDGLAAVDAAARSHAVESTNDARWLGWCRLRYEVEMTDQFWSVAIEATTAAHNEERLRGHKAVA